MPDDHDPRVASAIEAFLEGPAIRTELGASAAAPATSAADVPPPRRRTIRPGPPPPLDSRADWNAALRMEAARHERYGRPVSVIVIEAWAGDRTGREPARVLVDALAAQLGRVLRDRMRETDRITRVAANRFHVLLPETGRDQAARFVERVEAAGELEVSRGSLGIRLRTAIGTPGPEATLIDALATAEAELAG